MIITHGNYNWHFTADTGQNIATQGEGYDVMTDLPTTFE
jgi:uncharacterized protein YegP (UPF0339 family)